MQRSGFTLIEMLAAILFPVFTRTMKDAKRASCACTLEHIGLAAIQDPVDYDGCLSDCNYCSQISRDHPVNLKTKVLFAN